MKWPSLPSVVQGMGGPITVKEVKQPTDEKGEGVDGTWEPTTRTIEIKRSAPNYHKWRLYFHELHHATLGDSGLAYLLNDDSEEALCDAAATARVVEMLYG